MWSSVVSMHNKLRSSHSPSGPQSTQPPHPHHESPVPIQWWPCLLWSPLSSGSAPPPACVLSLLGISYTRLIQSPCTQRPYRAHSKPLRVNDTQVSAALFSIVSCHSQHDKIMYTSANFLPLPGHCAMAKGGSCSSPYLSVLH